MGQSPLGALFSGFVTLLLHASTSLPGHLYSCYSTRQTLTEVWENGRKCVPTMKCRVLGPPSGPGGSWSLHLLACHCHSACRASVCPHGCQLIVVLSVVDKKVEVQRRFLRSHSHTEGKCRTNIQVGFGLTSKSEVFSEPHLSLAWQ